MKQLPEKIEDIVQEFTNKVYELLGARGKKIILYGSYARGDLLQIKIKRTNKKIYSKKLYGKK